jgi:sodium transport system permease protein
MGQTRSNTADTLPSVVAVLAMLFGVGLMSLGVAAGRSLGIRANLMVSETLLMTPGLVALTLSGIPLTRGTGLRAISGRMSLLSLVAGTTLWAASLGLLELQYTLWAPPGEYVEIFRRLHEALRPTGVVDAAVSVLAIAVFPAACEEILVRGIVLPAFVRSFGPAVAVVASAVLFGLMHLDPYRFPFTAAVGLVLGIARLRTGSVLPTILAHTTLNALTFVVTPYLDQPTASMPDPQPLLGLALATVGGGLTALAIKWLRR